MAAPQKTRAEILQKFGIDQLNAMQEEAIAAIPDHPECLLLSPTGTGKTLAFLLPVMEMMDREREEVQALVVVPSRELAIQIEQVARNMGMGFKTNAVYGGRPFSKDKVDLKHRPALLIGTPGRLADHLRRKTFSARSITTLILDEFDKSLEVGYEEEMQEILRAIPGVKTKLLTSATREVALPSFLRMKDPVIINYLDKEASRLKMRALLSPQKDKLEALGYALRHLADQSGIVFCNFKDSIQRISDYLLQQGIEHGCYYGDMEQVDRDRTLIKFRNGTHRILLTTDLAARGIDIPEIGYIIHYHLPAKAHEFTHRNGRTARMHAEGTAFILHWDEEVLPDYLPPLETHQFSDTFPTALSLWTTLYISGGRKDKISKSDIAGLFIKQVGLTPEDLGVIEIRTDCAFVSVPKKAVKAILPLVNNQKLKAKKVRVTIL